MVVVVIEVIHNDHEPAARQEFEVMKDWGTLKLNTFFMSRYGISSRKLDADETTVSKHSFEDELSLKSAFVRETACRLRGIPKRNELRRIWIKYIWTLLIDANFFERGKINLIVSAQLSDGILQSTNMAGDSQLQFDV